MILPLSLPGSGPPSSPSGSPLPGILQLAPLSKAAPPAAITWRKLLQPAVELTSPIQLKCAHSWYQAFSYRTGSMHLAVALFSYRIEVCTWPQKLSPILIQSEKGWPQQMCTLQSKRSLLFSYRIENMCIAVAIPSIGIEVCTQLEQSLLLDFKFVPRCSLIFPYWIISVQPFLLLEDTHIRRLGLEQYNVLRWPIRLPMPPAANQ